MSWRKIAARLEVPVTTLVEGCRQVVSGNVVLAVIETR
jgi:hypothetical protein